MSPLTRICELVREVDERKPPSSTVVFSVSEGRGIVPQSEIFTKQIATTDKSKYRRIQYGDVVYNPYLLWNRAVGVCFSGGGGCVSPAYPVLRPLQTGVERFLHYFFRSPTFTNAIDAIATGSVTRRRTAPLTEILDLEFELPSFGDQRNANHLLSVLDKKIELNRQMNKTLEILAQSLFKSWFMDTTQASLPKGWRELPLSQAIEVNPPRQLRKGEIAPYLEMANLPTQSARALDVANREFSSGMRFKNGDTLVARITPCLENGKTCFVDFLRDGEIGWGSTEYLVLQPKPPLPPEFAYFLARTEELRVFMISNMTGTTGRQRVPAECLDNFKIAIPPAKIAEEFGQFASAVFAQMKAHDEESRTLAALRDALLPKLLSGELRVPAAAKLTEARA